MPKIPSSICWLIRCNLWNLFCRCYSLLYSSCILSLKFVSVLTISFFSFTSCFFFFFSFLFFSCHSLSLPSILYFSLCFVALLAIYKAFAYNFDENINCLNHVVPFKRRLARWRWCNPADQDCVLHKAWSRNPICLWCYLSSLSALCGYLLQLPSIPFLHFSSPRSFPTAKIR